MPSRSIASRRRKLVLALMLWALMLAIVAAYGWRRYGDDAVETLFGDRGDAGAVEIPASEVAPGDVSYRVASTYPHILLDDASTLARLRDRLAARTPAALRFKALVDAQVAGGDDYAFQPWFAALMYQLTGEPAYASYAIARTDAAVSAEEALIARNQPVGVADDSYLGIGDIIGNLALVYDWCHDRLTPAQRSRWITYGNQAVWNVWHPTRAQWGDQRTPWTGWSVDNPSNNYYYSFLKATMLLGLATHGENEQAPTWLDTFRVAKLERQLFPTFRRDLQGGGSREGTGYGTAMRTLFLLFDWWERSTGERLADKTPHPYESMAALIYNTAPTLDRLAPTGDHARESTAALFDYHRDYLLTLIALFPERPLSGVAVTYLRDSTVPVMKLGFNAYADFLYGDPEVGPRPLDALPTAYYASGTGQISLRADWRRTSAWSSFICGANTESHAHHDQGSFVLYRDAWLAPDANIYSHSGLEQAEAFHNLLRFESAGRVVKQKKGPGCDLLALRDDADFSYLRADLAPSYRGQPEVRSDEREFIFLKPSTFVVIDRAETGEGVRRVWTLNVPQRPTLRTDGYRVESAGAVMDVQRLWPPGLATRVTDWTDPKAQIAGGFRVEAVDERLAQAPFIHVIRLGAQAAPPAVATDGPNGVAVALDLGQGAHADLLVGRAPGSTRLRLAAADQVRFDGPLPAGLTPLAPIPR